jgi:hypothetical protein
MRQKAVSMVFFPLLPSSISHLPSHSQLLMSSDITDSEDIAPNRKRVYDKHERAVIDVFKDKYFEAKTSTSRKVIAQLDIFPALFNYWKSIGKVYGKKQTRMKSDVC